MFLALALTALPAACAAETSPAGPGTRAMAERLRALKEDGDARRNSFANKERVRLYRSDLEPLRRQPDTAETKRAIYRLKTQLARELLNAGDTPGALKELDAIAAYLKRIGSLGAPQQAWIDYNKGLAYLRLGEQENCLALHTVESCLLPIQGGGVHTLPKGSRGAIEHFSALLQANPGDARAIWLLNLAYMTLGEHPDKVPPRFLMPPRVFQSDHDIKRFHDVSPHLKLDVDGAAGGVMVDDFNGDGYLDIIMSKWGLTDQIQYFQSTGGGAFVENTTEAGLTGVYGGLNLVQADYDNDGDLDFVMLRGAWLGEEGHHPNSLIRNNGDGTFEDVTEPAGLLSFHPTQAATWFDYNGDGWLDLFVGNESTPNDPHPCELYRNNGDGTFTESAAASGLNLSAFVKSVASGDYNQDGRPDLYLGCRGGQNYLLRNDGPRPGEGGSAWAFSDQSKPAGVTEPEHTFPAWFFDYNNDGWLDIFAAGYAVRTVGDVALDMMGRPHPAEKSRLFKNNQDGTFSDVTRDAKLDKVLLAMPGNFGDLDNDGYLDIYLGTGDPDLGTIIPNRMFRNAEGRFFQDVTASGGFGHLQKGHGIAFGDLDNDGDQDVYEVMGGAYEGDNYRNVLFANPGHGNHWLTLQLEGTNSNRSAIGARIKVTVDTGRGTRSIFKWVTSGASFGGSPLRQEIGLGRAERIMSVEVMWPRGGRTREFSEVTMNRFYRLREGGEVLEHHELKSWPFKPGMTMPHHHE